MVNRRLFSNTSVVALGLCLGAFGTPGCGDDDDPAAPDAVTAPDTATPDTTNPPDTSGLLTADQSAILAVPETERWSMPGLTSEVHVVRTEHGIPHIYGANAQDVGRVLGFVQARDRYFFMDLQRRVGLGNLSELMGDLALDQDFESRGTGILAATERMYEHLSPELRSWLEAFAAGVNAYVAAGRRGEVELPTELGFYALFGYDKPEDMLFEMDVKGLVGMATFLMYQTNFEKGDVGRAAAAARLEAMWSGGEVKAELRRQGYLADIWNDIRPILPGSGSTEGFGRTGVGTDKPTAGGGSGSASGRDAPARMPAKSFRAPAAPRVPYDMLQRLDQRMDAYIKRLGKDRPAGFGSNSWAVMGSHSTDGSALLASDGHLSLTIPSLGWGTGLDTRVFGDGAIHQFGGWLGNFPVMIGGTNGDIAFGGVNPGIDITDWYREELQLDEDGRPVASLFEGQWRQLVAIDEVYDIAEVRLFDSAARTETWTRYETFDGRMITEIEGVSVASVDDAAPGAHVVNLLGRLVVPQDTDGDGVVTAISFDHAALDATRWPDALYEISSAKTVDDVREATRGYVGGALFTAAADSQGNVLYTSYQAIPCRNYLPRQGDGFADGADPTMLIDGTRFGGFSLPTGEDGKIDEAPGVQDPYKCAVPADDVPYAINPDEGYVFTANNDPGTITDDGNHLNDSHYMGGPWAAVRANTIRRELQNLVEAKEASMDSMAELQGNKVSRLGEAYVPLLLRALDSARVLAESGDVLTPWEQRLADLHATNETVFSEVATRLAGWRDNGFNAASGVETFYEQVQGSDVDDSIATMIYNAWQPRFMNAVWNDEGITAWRWHGDRQRLGNTLRFLNSRGKDNPQGHASWDPDTEEAVFFDRLGTEQVERSDELMLEALLGALEFLRSEPVKPGEGGFGTDDMGQWLWGLRHKAKFESIMAGFLPKDLDLSFITDMFSITTERLPLADSFTADDPRRGLKWFPRGGDQYAVDAANPGLSGTRFDYGSGPAMRMVFALKDGEVQGKFTLPGGQSGIVDSPHFDDLAALWLGNDTVPVRFSPADVVAGAVGREVYTPAP